MTAWPGSPGSGAPTACSFWMSHSRTVPSRLLVASVRSSRLIVSQWIGPACPEKTRVMGVQSAVDQTCAPSELESAIRRPLGEKRAVSTPPSILTLRARRLVRASQISSLLQQRDRDQAAVGAYLHVGRKTLEGQRRSERAPVGQRPEAHGAVGGLR